jgi:glyoxylase-like metal-dependent hydrolase (beta-lactamase superfamily II)
MIVDDPIYLAEPFIQSTTYQLDPNSQIRLEPCTTSFDENGGSDPHAVPHYLPGKNKFLTEWLERENWIPAVAARGGAATTYPEYRLRPNAPPSAPLSRTAVAADRKIADQSPNDGEVHVLPVQGNVYMLIADGSNIAVSVGPDGILMVDTGSARVSDKVVAAVKQLAITVAGPAPNNCMGLNCARIPYGWSSPFMNTIISSPAPPKPLRYIINTSASSDHTGGNEKVASAGYFPRAGVGAVADVGQSAAVIAHENVLNRMSAPTGKQAPAPSGAWPTDTYHRSFYKLSEYFNGEPVIAYHAPAAHTDGDSIVLFRHSEVISAGNIFSTVSYPLIDLEKGGSVQGIVDGLNQILDLAVAEYRSQGGTWIIPGHGRLSDTADVASYRNMVVMVRDRVQDMIKSGLTLEQVKAAKPTMDFDGRYGSNTGSWTTNMFVEAVYRSLREKK